MWNLSTFYVSYRGWVILYLLHNNGSYSLCRIWRRTLIYECTVSLVSKFKKDGKIDVPVDSSLILHSSNEQGFGNPYGPERSRMRKIKPLAHVVEPTIISVSNESHRNFRKIVWTKRNTKLRIVPEILSRGVDYDGNTQR
jgi:hypothetical protein